MNIKGFLTETEISFDRKKAAGVRYKQWLIISILTGVVLVTTIIATGRYLRFQNNPNPSNDDPNDDPRTLTTNDSDYEFITRKQYGALPSKTVNEPLMLPIKRVIISHTATYNCTEYSTCALSVRRTQEYHMGTNGWDDIGLNFVVGGDGRAYEGCGYTVGAHTYGYNRVSICIPFIGSFASYGAPQKQLRAAQRIIEDGIKTNKIHRDYVLYGQRQLRNFDSPSIMLYNQIMLWPHWSNAIIPL